MSYLTQLIFCFTVLVFVLLALQVVYLLVFALAGRFVKTKKYAPATNLKSFVIYIPSYKEDAVIVDTAKAAMLIDYPENKR